MGLGSPGNNKNVLATRRGLFTPCATWGRFCHVTQIKTGVKNKDGAYWYIQNEVPFAPALELCPYLWFWSESFPNSS
jgi:hypothetical protein